MSNFSVVVLLGLPGSGKTTLTARLGKFLSHNANFVVHRVSFDDLVSVKQQQEAAESKFAKDFRNIMRTNVESVLTNFNSGTSFQTVVLVDDNNYYCSMRYEFYQLAAKYCAGYLAVFINCSVEEACIGNQSRPTEERVSDDVIHKMALKFEDPRDSWENCLKLDLDASRRNETLETIRLRISETLLNPVLTLKLMDEKRARSEVDRLINHKNVVHKVDQILRKMIGEMIQQERKDHYETRVLAKTLNDLRQKLLHDIKQEKVAVPAALVGHEAMDNQLLKDWVASRFLADCEQIRKANPTTVCTPLACPVLLP